MTPGEPLIEPLIDRLLVRGVFPDWLLRAGIRRLLRQRLQDEKRKAGSSPEGKKLEFVAILRQSPLAVSTDDANRQHYEVPSSFFQLVLGRHLKYSSGLWSGGIRTLDAAEEAMLRLTCERAGLHDGQKVLELGCGWGSLSLWMAGQYPGSRITAVSNSASQKVFIDGQAASRGLKNLQVITADMRTFDTSLRFDRIVSVEMFEHMRNYELLLKSISGWLEPHGSLFVHIFTHREFAYLFEDEGDEDWMARHFFTGGQMPSDDLLPRFDRDLVVTGHWTVSGTNYGKTAEAWLSNMDREEPAIRAIFRETYGPGHAQRWWVYWRVFFLSCAELWNFGKGREWLVSHYLFEKRDQSN